MKLVATFMVAGPILCLMVVTPAYAACYNIPKCHTTTRYENRPYQQNICQYYGQQRSCYVATRSNWVPVTSQQCTQQRYCEGGFHGMLNQPPRR